MFMVLVIVLQGEFIPPFFKKFTKSGADSSPGYKNCKDLVKILDFFPYSTLKMVILRHRV